VLKLSVTFKKQETALIQQGIDNFVSKIKKEDFQHLKDELTKNPLPNDPSTSEIH
jgi:hypothetical protein